MSLPALGLATLRHWRGHQELVEGLRSDLRGTVQLLPASLGRTEREELVEAYGLLLDLPLQVMARLPQEEAELGRGGIVLLTEPLEAEPSALPGVVLLASRRHLPGDRHLDLPRGVMLLRDAVIEHVGRRFHGTRLGALATWISRATDSPGTAIRFADGVWRLHLREPAADERALFAAGLAASLGWLLRGVDTRVVEWVLALALPVAEPERVVGTDAALLGRDAALMRAFAEGLVHNLPEEKGGRLDLRRPFAVLGRLGEMLAQLHSDAVVAALASELEPAVWAAVRRPFAMAEQRLGLGLGGPKVPAVQVGHKDVIARLVALLEPGNEVRTVVLYGLPGIGKTTVAGRVAQELAPRLEPVWVSFVSGPEAGWERVALALGIDFRRLSIGVVDRFGVPRWVREVQDRLRHSASLVVVDDVDGVPESALPAWLPHGAGRAAVLVLSRNAQRPLSRAHDAIAVALGPLSLEESRLLLAAQAPNQRQAVLEGRADALIRHLGHHPLALDLAAPLLQNSTIEEALEQLAGSAGAQDRVTLVLNWITEDLSEAEENFLFILALGAPEGSPKELPLRMTGRREMVSLERLLERGLIEQEGNVIWLHPSVRSFFELKLVAKDEAPLRFQRSHALAVAELGRASRQQGGSLEDRLYENLLLALSRSIQNCALGRTEWIKPGIQLAHLLLTRAGGNSARDRRLVIDACEVMLKLVQRDVERRRWLVLHLLLGQALADLPAGERSQNLLRAVAIHEQLLSVLSKEEEPDRWAEAQLGLSYALTALPTGDREAQSERAIAAAEAALSRWTRDQSPGDWWRAQGFLGMALLDRRAGERESNIRRAIAAFQAALEVANDPLERARLQSQLAKAWTRLDAGDRTENLRRAVALAEEALGVLTPRNDPEGWARCQNHLGRALTQLSTGDRLDNLRRAIAAHQAALSVFTREDFPWEWARTHRYLGRAFAALPTGDRAENLRRAVSAYRDAATVLTLDAFPSEAKQLEDELGAALTELSRLAAAGGETASPPPPPAPS